MLFLNLLQQINHCHLRFFSIFFLIICLSSCDKKKSTSSNQNLDALDNDSISISEKYYKEGLEYYDNGDLEKAKESYKLAIDSCVSKNFNVHYKYFSDLFGIYLSKNEYGDAIASIKDFEQLDVQPKIDKMKLAYAAYIAAYSGSSSFTEALDYTAKLYQISEETNDSSYKIHAIFNESSIYHKLGDNKKAFNVLNDLRNSNSNFSSSELSFITGDLGMYKFYEGDFKGAIDNYSTSLFFYKKSKIQSRTDNIAVQYANIAEAYIELNNLEKAAVYLDSFRQLDQGKVDNKRRRNVFKYELRLLKASKSDNKRIESLVDKITLDQEKFYSERYNKDLEYLSEEKEKSETLLIENQQAELDRLALRNNFILIISILIIGLLVALFFVFKQRRDNEIKALRDQQRLLRAQMNPHFIFNVLSNIQNLLRNDSKAASRFITKFSRLLRKVLENSMQNYVAVVEEVEVLTNYLELQKLRFPKLFIYDFKLDERLNDEMISIPPMLIQPFVENAIEHGFKGINYTGEIKIELIFTTENKRFLSCFISDNGKGHTHVNNEDKKSASVQLISDFIKKSTGSSIETNYLDLDQKTGTLITFQIPIQ